MATATPIYDPSLSGGGGGGFTPTGDYYIPFGNVGHTTLIDSAKLTFNDSTNTFEVAAASSGGTVKRSVRNTSNTASSNALDLIEVAGASANDPFTQYSISGVANFVSGIDNSNTDLLTWNPGTALSSSATGMRMDSTGCVSFGTGTPVGATTVPVIVDVNTSNAVWTQAYNRNIAGAIGLRINATLGAGARGMDIQSVGSSSSGLAALAGVAAASTNRIKSDIGLTLVAATAGPQDVVLGANDTEILRLTSTGTNVLFNGMAAPASMAKGIAIANGTAPSADPSGGGVMWSASAILSYRGSGATTGIQNLSRTYRAIANANSTVTVADDNGVLAYTSLATSDKTCTLPNLATVRDGFQVTVYLDCVAGGFKVTVSGDGNIVGAASFLLDTDYEAATFVKNATDWTVI